MLDESTHKYAVSFESCGGGNEGKEAIIDVSVNNPGATTDKDGMASLSMEVSMIGMTWFGVADPCGS